MQKIEKAAAVVVVAPCPTRARTHIPQGKWSFGKKFMGVYILAINCLATILLLALSWALLQIFLSHPFWRG